MTSRSTGLAAAFIAGLAGSGLAIAVGGALGTFGGSTTTTISQPVATSAPATLPVRVVTDLDPTRFDAQRIYRERADGVVTISATVGRDAVSGSGFVIAESGYIITNAHVVTDSPDPNKRASDVHPATAVYVRFGDGNSLPATIVGYDLFDDIAVLKVDPRHQPLTVLRFSVAGRLRVGDPVAVIGSPFGAEQQGSLSVGVVSALGRDIQAPAVSFATPNAIQTDAAINHGNSGGPVFDASGRVIGVAAQIESTGGGGEGVAFAIPASAAKRSYEALVASGVVRYAWLGVSTHAVSRELARTFHLGVSDGLLVDEVTAGGPAEHAGITPGRRTATYQDDGVIHPDGDIIVSLGGRAVHTSADLSLAVSLARPGMTVPIVVVRQGQRLTLQVTLGQRPTNL